MICSSGELSQLDDDLSALYQKAKDHPSKKEILSELKVWLTTVRNKCQDELCLKSAYDDFVPIIEKKLNEPRLNISQNIKQEKLKDFASNNSQVINNDEVKNKKGADSDSSKWIWFLGTPIGAWFWNKFLRKRCPSCKSTNFSVLNAEELDRWRQAKKVTERTSTGKTREKHVQVTYVKIRRKYECNECKHLWSEITSEEK